MKWRERPADGWTPRTLPPHRGTDGSSPYSYEFVVEIQTGKCIQGQGWINDYESKESVHVLVANTGEKLPSWFPTNIPMIFDVDSIVAWRKPDVYDTKKFVSYEVVHSMDGKLHPCPFCGSQFHLIHETWENTHNKKIVHGYYWEAACSSDCLFSDITEHDFHMGAGDVNIETGYVGEYGTRWNKHFEGKNVSKD